MENTLTNAPTKEHKVTWQGIALAAGFVLLAALAAWMVVSQLAGGRSEQKQAAARAAFEAETGIRVVRVVMTAGGGMIDLQYQVLDPDKSLIVHDDDSPPTLVDDASGLLLATPWHDHNFRELHTGVTYHELIMNGSDLLDRGSTVTISVGDAQLENIDVQ